MAGSGANAGYYEDGGGEGGGYGPMGQRRSVTFGQGQGIGQGRLATHPFDPTSSSGSGNYNHPNNPGQGKWPADATYSSSSHVDEPFYFNPNLSVYPPPFAPSSHAPPLSLSLTNLMASGGAGGGMYGQGGGYGGSGQYPPTHHQQQQQQQMSASRLAEAVQV